MSAAPLRIFEWIQKNKTHRSLILLALFALGLALVMFPNGYFLSNGLQNLGISITTSSLLALFIDVFILPNERGEMMNVIHSVIADTGLIRPAGLALVAKARHEYPHFNSWIWSSYPSNIRIFGISILHSIDRDLSKNFKTSARKAILKRLDENAKIYISLLDPRSRFIQYIAQMQNQNEVEIRKDILESIKIAKEIFDNLGTISADQYEINISLYDDYPAFSLHAVDEETLIGFYARTHLGRNSPIYKVGCDVTKEYMEKHFTDLKGSTTWLLTKYPSRRPQFNFDLYKDICAKISIT